MKATRRQFLKESSKFVISGIIGANLLNKITQAEEQGATELSSSRCKVKYRVLGRTGLRVSVISMGTVSTRENVIKYAMREGINFIHTSLGYSGGKSIKRVGQAIKGHRRKVILGLKVTWDWNSDEQLDKALRILKTDYVDILFFNIHNNPKRVASPQVKEAFERWKKQGKVKFMGLTTHGGMIPCMESALKTGWYDCLMPTYRLERHEEYLKIFEKCEKRNIGFVAMKTGISPDNPDRTSAILKDKRVTTICRTIRTFSDVKKYIEASNKKLSRNDVARAIELARLSSFGRCMMCGACTLSCPQQIAVSDIVRCVDYYVDTMHDVNLAFENYSEITNGKNAQGCKNCGICENNCPNGVPIRHYISRAGRIFA